MKPSLNIPLFSVPFLALSLSAQPGPPGSPADPAESHAPESRRVFVLRGSEKPEMETVAYLGVETSPVGPALSAQLGLAKDTGLLIRHVLPESPAAGILQTHDILLKIDDQVLIEPRQFSVLVRSHKAGEEITLIYVRVGKQVSARIKLGQHDVPKMSFFEFPVDGPVGMPGAGRQTLPPLRDREVDHVLTLVEPDHNVPGRPRKIPFSGKRERGFHSSTVDINNSSMVFSDDEGSVELTSKGGKKILTAKNPKGEVIFSGPVDTTEQRAVLTDQVRQRLEKLENMEEFDFRPEENLRENVRFYRPEPTRMERRIVPPALSRDFGGQGI